MINYEEDIEKLEVATSSNKENGLKKIGDKVNELVDLIKDRDDLEQQLKELNKEINNIEGVQLPEIFDEYGLSKIELDNGAKLLLKEEWIPSIPTEGKEKAFSWLRYNGFEDLIKNKVELTFSKGQDNLAKEVINSLVEQGLSPTSKEDVHWQTLRGFCKEQMTQGNGLPQDIFNVFHKRTVEIKKGK